MTMESLPRPSYPYDHGDTIKAQGDSGNNLCEEQNLFLHSCELELCVARHGYDTAHDGVIASGEDHSSAFSLGDNRGIESEITSLHYIV